MTDIQYFRQLHLKSVLGEPLTPEEQKELAAWYQEMEEAEAAVLNVTYDTQRVDNLQAQIDDALKELLIVSNGMRELVAENEALRRRNAQLIHIFEGG